MALTILLPALAVALSATMIIAWAVATATGRSGWIDAIWSFSIGIFGSVAALVPLGGLTIAARQIIVTALVLLWSLRLGIHIARRTTRGGDDPRYAQLRKEWGGSFRARLFWFLQIQAGAAYVLVVSVLAAAHNPAPTLRLGDWLGILILLIAIVGEAVADRQLAAFAANSDNKGKVCGAGLWGLSRHPNYFFEWLGWVAYAAIAISPMGGYPWGWIALAAPVFMYWLLVNVSGVPPLEGHMLRSRGDAFRDYQARVNAFWPGPQHNKGRTA